MITRIVKMNFKPEGVKIFKDLFLLKRSDIASVEGCISLQLMQDTHNENTYFTISTWEHSDYLEKYRHSELFKLVWGKTKIWFNEKPEAWSLNEF